MFAKIQETREETDVLSQRRLRDVTLNFHCDLRLGSAGVEWEVVLSGIAFRDCHRAQFDNKL
jgi:hypothetical protein